jgi:hypothetical protein
MSMGAEHLRRQSGKLAIAIGNSVVWIIVALKFRKYPRAENVSEPVDAWRRTIAPGEGRRSEVPCRNKGTG